MKQYRAFQAQYAIALLVTWFADGTWVASVILVALTYFILVQLGRLITFIRLQKSIRLGKQSSSDVRAIDLLMHQSTNLTYRYFIPTIAVTVPLLVLPLIYDLPRLWLIVGVWSAISAVVAILAIIRPPLILLLSASSRDATKLHVDLAAAVVPLRVAHCLLPHRDVVDTPLPIEMFAMVPSSLRTFNEAQWRYTVATMLDVVTLIIVNADQVSEAVDEELAMIRERGLETKTIVVGTPENTSGIDLDSPTLNPDELVGAVNQALTDPGQLAQENPALAVAGTNE